MNPVFTLQWSEFQLANQLQALLPKKRGFSVLIPASRQEKGFDLAVLKKNVNGASRVVTIQVKASRVYMPEPPRRKTTERFRFYTWFGRFDVPEEADFILLFGMYAPDLAKTRRVGASWYKDCTLLFTRQEMKDFMKSCLTVKGKPDKMFAFGFNDKTKIVQVRGDKDRSRKSFTDYLIEKRIGVIKEKLGG